MNTLSKALITGAFFLALPLAAAAECPMVSVSGQQMTLNAESVYAPQTMPIVAGGGLDLSQCGSVPGNGYIVPESDFTVAYDALGMGRALEMRVNGTCDTVLLVNAADGQWHFSDDADGMNPRLRIENARSGQYDVWVGTFGPETCDATITFESF